MTASDPGPFDGSLSPSLAATLAEWRLVERAAGAEPVVYSLTPTAREVLLEPAAFPFPGLDDPERLAQWCGFTSAAAMVAAYEMYDQAEAEAAEEAEWADNWDSCDSAAYVARVEAGLEPEAEPWP